MRITNRISYGTLAVLVGLGTAGGASASAQDAEWHGKGVHLAVGFIGQSLDLRNDAGRALNDAGIDLASVGTGAEFVAGYRFGRHMSLGLRISGSEHDTGRDDVKAGVGMGLIEFTGHMRPGQRVQPYLTGGFGGSAIVLDPDRGKEVSVEGAAMAAGAGVDFLVGNHWTLGFAYRGAMINYERATIELDGQDPVEFRGAGLSHEFGFRWELRI